MIILLLLLFTRPSRGYGMENALVGSQTREIVYAPIDWSREKK